MKKTGMSRLGGATKAALALSLLPISIHLQALEYQVNEDLKVNFDTTLTYGRQWRVEGRDKNNLTYTGEAGGMVDNDGYGNIIGNRGEALLLNGQIKQSGYGGKVGDPLRVAGMPQGGDPRAQHDFTNLVMRINSDDGDRNFDTGDVVSSRYAALSDLNISYKNVGMFLRGQIFYDEVPFEENNWNDDYIIDKTINDKGVTSAGFNGPYGRGTINNYADGEISNRKHFGDGYKEELGYDARFLDAYVYGSFPIGDSTLDLRVGRQVISWGEALMLPGGMGMAQNRIDAPAALAVPGADLKEIFLPTGAVYGSMNVMEGLTLEAYWQYEWIESSLFPSGSYFNMNDALSSDVLFSGMNSQYAKSYGEFSSLCGGASGHAGYGDPDLPLYDISGCAPDQIHGIAGSNGIMTRTGDVTPDDDKQFGIAMRYLLGEGTEMGVYIINYHDKLPTLWAANDNGQATSDSSNVAYAEGSLEYNPVFDHYTIRYMDNIRMYGLTLNTVIGDVQTGIEYGYRANTPIVTGCSREVIEEGRCKDKSLEKIWEASNNYDYSSGERVVRNDGDNTDGSGHFTHNQLYGAPNDTDHGQVAGLQYMLMGWPVRAELHTLNIGMTYIFEPSALWDNAIMVGELGNWYIGGLEDDQLMQSHLGSFTKTGNAMSAQFMPEYKNVLEGVDLVVPFFMQYTIEGDEAYLGFSEKSLWWSAGVEANYLEHWRVATYYNNFSGPNNLWSDRDNISLNVKYVF